MLHLIITRLCSAHLKTNGPMYHFSSLKKRLAHLYQCNVTFHLKTTTFNVSCLTHRTLATTRVQLHNTQRSLKAETKDMRNTPEAQASKRTPQTHHTNTHKCSKCGMNVAGGWGHYNHNKVCTLANFTNPARCTTPTAVLTTPVVQDALLSWDADNLNARQQNELDFCHPEDDEHFEQDTNTCGINALAAELSEYLASLPNLDSQHICECLHWGRIEKQNFSGTTREVARFLKVSMLGQGLSGEHMQAFLDYTHEIGGKKTVLLPKKIEGCWNALAKVIVFVKCRYVCWGPASYQMFRSLDHDPCWCGVLQLT